MVNRIVLQGRLTRDPEARYTQSNIAFCDFTVAWSERYKENETKCFLRCRAWRYTAEHLTKYFTKGQEILVEGRMETQEWERDGQKNSMTMCQVDKVHFCGPKAERRDGSQMPPPDNDGFMNVPEGSDEEIPFE